jgi:hypothetical protein
LFPTVVREDMCIILCVYIKLSWHPLTFCFALGNS